MNGGENSSVTNGCHSIEAQRPVLGSGKLLEKARAAMLYETNSDTTMYAWNADEAMYPASLVKIMTAMLALENADPAETVTVSVNAMAAIEENNATLELQVGEKLSLDSLLYGLMVGSANDAAVVIADHIAGSQQGFVYMMNERAKELGCTGTNFTNPHGLHEDAQVTTARDMVRILREAMQSERFMEYFSELAYTIPATDLSEERYVETTNFLMTPSKIAYYNGRVTGGRTGVTTDRERCIIVTAESGGLSYIAVILGAMPTFEADGYTPKYFGSYEEANDLLKLGFDGYSVTQVLAEGQALNQYAVNNGQNHVAAGPSRSISTVLPKGIGYENLSVRYQQTYLTLDAPVEKGQSITSVQIWYGNICLGQSPIIALNSSYAVGSQSQQSPEKNSEGLVTVLIVIGCVFGVLACLWLSVRILVFVRRAVFRAQYKRRSRNRRRSK